MANNGSRRTPLAIRYSLLAVLILALAGCGGEGGTSATETAEKTPNPDGTINVAIDASGDPGGRVEVEAEVADDDAERTRGLMERTELAEDAGMLFVFDREQPRSFWMRNTLIPLSIAYIDGESRIVDIEDMEPLDETPHPSAEPAQYALEVNQGFFAERGVEVGDQVELPELPAAGG